MSKTERGDFDWNQGIRRSPPLTLGYLNQGNSFGIKHLIISVLFLVSFWDIKRKESLLGLRRAFFSFSPLLLDSLTQCPLHMSGQMAWTLGGRFSCSRTQLCLTSSTWLSFSSSWSRSEVLISLISLMRTGGTGLHFEFAAKNKLVCLTPSDSLHHFSIQKENYSH